MKTAFVILAYIVATAVLAGWVVLWIAVGIKCENPKNFSLADGVVGGLFGAVIVGAVVAGIYVLIHHYIIQPVVTSIETAERDRAAATARERLAKEKLLKDAGL